MNRSPVVPFLTVVVATAAVSLLVAGPAARAQTLAADYQVQNTFASAVGTIAPLAPVGTLTDTTFATTVVEGQTQQVIRVAASGTFAVDGGVQSQTAGSISATNYSAVLLAAFQFTLGGTTPVASKLLDFANLSSDAGLYINTATGALDFFGAAPTAIGSSTVVTPGTFTQLVLTRNGTTGLTTLYQDGVQAFSFTDTNNVAVLSDATPTGNAFLTLLQDDGQATLPGNITTNENTAGDIARLRLYDGVLSAADVAGLDRAIPEPSTWALLALGGLGAAVGGGLGRRRRQ